MFTDPDDNITIKGTVFIEPEGLLKLVMRNSVNTQLIGKENLKTYNNNDNNVY